MEIHTLQPVSCEGTKHVATGEHFAALDMGGRKDYKKCVDISLTHHLHLKPLALSPLALLTSLTMQGDRQEHIQGISIL